MGKRLHKLTFYTLILAVYGVFFSIESFYNFEGHSEVREIIRHSSILHSTSAGSNIRPSHVHYPGSQKSRLRLNKRYHQEEFPPCTVYQAPAPPISTVPQELGTYAVRPLPTVSLFYPQLRGPPAIA